MSLKHGKDLTSKNHLKQPYLNENTEEIAH